MFQIICKFLIIYLIIMSATFASPKESEALLLKDKISSFVMSMEGVNGIGVGTCKAQGLDEPCLSIMTTNEQTAKVLRTLIPPTKRVDGILVEVDNVGVLRLQ